MDFRDRLAKNRDTRRRSEDHERMRVVAYEDVWVPAAYEVCSACEGRGKYVNPGIDSDGLSAEDMYELGDDFFEDYMSGTYDVTCDACDGRRVELVADRNRIDPVDLQRMDDKVESDASYEAECEAERRMGC